MQWNARFASHVRPKMADLERMRRAYEATTSSQEYELQGLSIGCVSEG